MLEVGKKAPDFELPDQNGEMHLPIMDSIEQVHHFTTFS